MKPSDLVVVVTGASSGIGRAVAHAFASRRCAVGLAAAHEDYLPGTENFGHVLRSDNGLTVTSSPPGMQNV